MLIEYVFCLSVDVRFSTVVFILYFHLDLAFELVVFSKHCYHGDLKIPVFSPCLLVVFRHRRTVLIRANIPKVF